MKRHVENPVRDLRCMWLEARKDGERTPCCAREQWQAVLYVKARRNAEFVRVVTPFKVCTRHRKDVTLDVLLNGGGWARLRQVLRGKGLKEPRRRLTELHFERINDLESKRACAPEREPCATL